MVKPDLFGLPVPAMGIPEVTLSVSLWMLVFALPTVIWLRERASAQSVPWGENFLSLGFRQACKSLQRLRQYKALSRYILAYMLFNDGITTAMLMASIFGAQVLGMKTDELILFFLLTQGTGLIGSVFFGFLADRIGHRTALLFTLIVWSLLIVWAFGLGFFGNAKGEFWVIGFLAGIALGGNLAVSRSLFGIMIPREHAAEFFGFLGLAGRFAAILGPIIYGFSLELTGSLQQSILALLVFFVVGGFLLLGVNERDI
jgi:UMF1 family MFS transporter